MSSTPSSAAIDPAQIADTSEQYTVTDRALAHHGWVWNVVGDSIDYHGTPIQREFIDHTGAVAVLAMDESERVLLISQYRHPVRRRNWEIPAGLLDHGPDESPLAAAQRELAEEADLIADRWDLLLDFWTTPGGSNESIRIYLARELRPTPQQFARVHEEADIQRCWMHLDDAVSAIFADRFHNPALLQALFAANECRRRNWQPLRAADTPWPTRPGMPTPVPRALQDGATA